MYLQTDWTMDVILSHNFIIDFLTNKKIRPKAKIYPLPSNSNFVLFCHENIKKNTLDTSAKLQNGRKFN